MNAPATEVPINRFVEFAAINVNDHVEKKGNLSYLSWPWAVDQLMRRDPEASWMYHEPVRFGDTMMVCCTVTAFGLARTMQLPVMDHKNKAIASPDAFQVNTAMQRCLVKAIALHGLGLYIYAGEDLPPGETPVVDEKEQERVEKLLGKLRDVSLTGWEALKKAWSELDDADRDALKPELPSLKKAAADADKVGRDA